MNGDIRGAGLLAIGRNVLKPIFLFIKSYGIKSFLPITILNGLWAIGLLAVIVQLFKRSQAKKVWDKRFLLPAVASGLMMLILPDYFLGVYQAGARFALPFILFLTFSAVHVDVSQRFKIVFLGMALAVTLYNGFYFRKVNDQATAFYQDLVAEVEFAEPFYVLRLDWPAGTSIWDKGSASVNPLSVVPYYAYVQKGGVGWIHETGILKLKEEHRRYAPDLKGETPLQFYSSILSRIERFTFFKSIAVLGKGEKVDSIIRELEKLGFGLELSAGVWTILKITR